MYVGLKQPRGDGEHYVTPARAAAKETRSWWDTDIKWTGRSSYHSGSFCATFQGVMPKKIRQEMIRCLSL